MKTKILLSISSLFLILSFSSCKKIKELLTFEIYNSSEFVVPSSTGINIPLSLNTPNVQSSSSQSFANNKTSADKIKDIKLTTLELSVTNPAGKTFSFLKSIKIYISGNGLPEKLLASKENITDDVGNTIRLETTGEKLDEYVKLSSYSLRNEVVTDETFFEDVTLKADMTFSVTADPL